MKKLEQELMKMNEKERVKEDEIKMFYNGRLKTLQERVKEEKEKRQHWEKVKN